MIHWILKVLLVLAALVGVLGQLVLIPLIAAEFAVSGVEGVVPEFAQPFLTTTGILAVLCLQVVMVALWRLLDLVAASRIFADASLRWVNVMIGAFVAAGLLSSLVLGYLLTAHGHAIVTLFVMVCAAAGFGAALLLVVMRALLVQATTLQTEMAAVI